MQYSLDRIPYEEKGKGKAVEDDGQDELEDYDAAGVDDYAASDGSSPSSVADDDIEMALAQVRTRSLLAVPTDLLTEATHV